MNSFMYALMYLYEMVIANSMINIDPVETRTLVDLSLPWSFLSGDMNL